MILDDKTSQQNLLRQWSQPMPDEAPSFSAWSFAKSGVKGLPMAGLEVAGSWADLLSGFATPYAASFGGDMLSGGDETARKKMLEQGSFDFGAGNILRAKADDYAADPMTSHRADVVMNGLTRTVGKAVGYLGTMGPIPGAVAFGADEGNTAAQRLMEKGVDPGTAAKVGGVTGVVSAASALIPVAGNTALQTAGLVAVSGPGLYMAQEALAKRILQAYPQEAETHDPTDPLGLALSIAVPAIAGGLHMRSVSKTKAKGEAALKAEATLTPEEQAKSDAFERSDANIQELRQAIASEKNPESKKILEAELETQLKAAKEHAGEVVSRASREPEAVDAARVKVQEARLQENLPDVPNARQEVMRAVDDLGAGEQPRVTPYTPPEVSFAQRLDAAIAERGIGVKAGERSEAAGEPGARVITLADMPEADFMAKHGNSVEDVKAHEFAHTFWAGATGLPNFRDPANKPLLAELKTVSKEFRPYAWETHPKHTSKPDELLADGMAFWLKHPERRADFPQVDRMMRSYDAGGLVRNFPDPQARQAAAETGSNALPPSSQVESAPTKFVEPEKAVSPEQVAAVDALIAEAPDTRVSIPGHESMTAAEAMETAKAEAQEIRSFGELVRTAVQCALQNGVTA